MSILEFGLISISQFVLLMNYSKPFFRLFFYILIIGTSLVTLDIILCYLFNYYRWVLSIQVELFQQ